MRVFHAHVKDADACVFETRILGRISSTCTVSGTISKTKAGLLCLLFILILSLCLFYFVSAQHQDKVGGIRKFFVGCVTF